MPPDWSCNHQPIEIDPAQVAQALAARADELFAEDASLAATDESDPTCVRQTMHLVSPYAEEQVKADCNDRTTASRTVERLRTLVLTRVTKQGGVSYELRDVDALKPHDPNAGEDAFRHRLHTWDTSGAGPAELLRGVNARGSTLDKKLLRGDQSRDLLSTIQYGKPWDAQRQTVINGVNGDCLISRKAFAGLRRMIARSGFVISSWIER